MQRCITSKSIIYAQVDGVELSDISSLDHWAGWGMEVSIKTLGSVSGVPIFRRPYLRHVKNCLLMCLVLKDAERTLSKTEVEDSVHMPFLDLF